MISVSMERGGMALTTCEDCQGEVSTSARACPQCGCRVRAGRFGPVWIARVILLLLAAYSALVGVSGLPFLLWGSALLLISYGVSFAWPKVAYAALLVTLALVLLAATA